MHLLREESHFTHLASLLFGRALTKGIVSQGGSQGARFQLVLQDFNVGRGAAGHSQGMWFPNLSSELRIIIFARQGTDLVLYPCPGPYVPITLLERNEKEN